MTEEEWLNCEEPYTMLKHPKIKGNLRKSKLFVVACCRHTSAHIKSKHCQSAIDFGESLAEGIFDERVRRTYWQSVNYTANRNRNADNWTGQPETGESVAAQAILGCLEKSNRQTYSRVNRAAIAVSWLQSGRPSVRNKAQKLDYAHERFLQADLLRDIFGNPFRPVSADPAWLTATVQSIASSIYQDRAFDRLPILADALEEAGCTNADVLLHCRQPGEHVRGCWVLDLVLGKQ